MVRRHPGWGARKEADLLIPAARGKSDERGVSASRSGVAPKRGSVNSQGSEDRVLFSEARQPEGTRASANMAARRQRGEGEDRVEPAGRAPVHWPPERAERSVAALWTGRRGLATRGPLRGGHSAPPPHAVPPRPGPPRAPRDAGLRAVGLGGSRAEPGRAPNPRRPARFTLACNRVGAHARQVQVPLRCAEGTYSWCSRLLAVSHTRR